MEPATLFVSFFAALFAIANPIGNVPFFIMYTTDIQNSKMRHAVAILLCPVIFITILLFMFLGSPLLDFFGISMPAFEIAGAIILITIAMSMLSGSHTDRLQTLTSSVGDAKIWKAAEAFIPKILVPLVIPIYVGGGTISVAVLWGHRAMGSEALLVSAISVVVLVSILIMICNLASDFIMRFLGKQGLEIVVRIFGIILMGISIQMLYEGISDMAVMFMHTNLGLS